MGNSISSARYMALGSFLVNFGTQTYGMFIKPNMKDIADANHFAFSPNPWFIAAFFSAQTVLQLYWIRKLFLLKPEGYQQVPTAHTDAVGFVETERKSEEQAAIRTAIQYAPIYALGNLCIAGWLFFWLRKNFTVSQILVTVNTVIQLYAVARLPPIMSSSPGLLRTTHLVAKTFAAIGVLDFIDNGGVALQYRAPPSMLIQVLTYILFPASAAFSTPVFGSFLFYDLMALCVGQRFGSGASGRAWGNSLGWTALAVSGIIGLKGFITEKWM